MGEAGVVDRPVRVGEQVAVQGAAEPVGGDDVHAPVAHPRGRVADRVQQPLDAGADLGRGGSPTLPAAGVGRSREVEQV
ncbi:MAG: hypothetical protein WCF04_07605, partial [Candidatus Nanopelagicales bacterium]